MAGKFTAGPDVDLKQEDVRDSRGRRITEEYAERAAQYDPSAVRPGRRSLSGGDVHSPRVSFRLPADLRLKAEKVAAQEGKSVSELAREALQRYLAS